MSASSTRGREPAVTVLKIGGELVESSARAAALAPAVAALAREARLAVVHGGGKDIDAEIARRGLTKQAVDGLRITDEETLAAVVASLAGTVNTRLVSSLVAAGVKAVGLTGADFGVVPAERAPRHRRLDGSLVDLGLVGEPRFDGPPALVADVLSAGYVPVIACLGRQDDGLVLNINADTLAAALAIACGARRLIVAGATAGVLDQDGRTIPTLDTRLLEDMIADGRATAGMVAKLRACRQALAAGMDVTIVDGRGVTSFTSAPGTRLAPLPSEQPCR